MSTIKKTTYEVEGSIEPCFEVTCGSAMVRIAKCYHYLGSDTIKMTEFLDGEFNGSDEYKGDFDTLNNAGAHLLAKEFSSHIY